MSALIFNSFKYVRIYLSFIFFGLASFLVNVLSGLNLTFFSFLGYSFVIFPIMPFVKIFIYFDLMLISPDGIVFPSDAAILIGHFIWCLFFFLSYFCYLYYNGFKGRSRDLDTVSSKSNNID